MIRMFFCLVALLCLGHQHLVQATTGTSLTNEQTIFLSSNHTIYVFACNSSTNNGVFCQTSVKLPSLGPVNNLGDNEFLNVSYDRTEYPSGPFVQPQEANCFDYTDASGASSRCCREQNPCDPNPCLNDQSCSADTEGEFVCKCNSSFEGSVCQTKKCLGGCPVDSSCSGGVCKCNVGYEENGNYCTAYCQKVKISGGKKCPENYNFPKTHLGGNAYSNETCKSGRARASVTCVKDVYGGWSFDIPKINCASCNETVTSILESITDENTPVTTEAVATVVSNLQLVTSTNKSVKQQEQLASATKVLNALERAVQNETVKVTPDTMRGLLDVAGQVTGGLVEIEKESEMDKSEITEAKKTIVEVIDVFAREVTLPENETELVIVTDTLVLKVVEPKPSEDGFPESVVYDTPGYVDLSKQTKSVKTTNTTDPLVKKKTISLTIPPDVLDEMNRIATAATGSMRLVFVLHQDASLLTVDKLTGQVIQATYDGSGALGPPTPLNYSFEIEHYDPVDPEEQPIQNEKTERERVVFQYDCVFWDYVAKDWSTAGCHYKNVSGRHICECNHFTSFALLLNVKKLNKAPTPDPFSIIACSVSIVCLLATIIIYLAIRELRKRRPTPILVNICICLVLGFLFFVTGVDRTGHLEYCYASALLMHTALLCSWFWMLIYSLNIYQALVKVVGRSSVTGNKLFMYMLGYGVPGLIVMVTFLATMVLDGQTTFPKGREDINFESAYRSAYMCWIQSYSLYLAFLVPVFIILFINTGLFFVTLRKLTWKRREIQSSREAIDTKQQVFMAVAMMSMMGLPWAFGFFTLVESDPDVYFALAIIFNLLNATQGIVIFCMNCVRQETVRVMWLFPVLKFFGCEKCIQKKQPPARTGDTKSLTNTGPTTSATGATTLPRESNASTANTVL